MLTDGILFSVLVHCTSGARLGVILEVVVRGVIDGWYITNFVEVTGLLGPRLHSLQRLKPKYPAVHRSDLLSSSSLHHPPSGDRTTLGSRNSLAHLHYYPHRPRTSIPLEPTQHRNPPQKTTNHHTQHNAPDASEVPPPLARDARPRALVTRILARESPPRGNPGA